MSGAFIFILFLIANSENPDHTSRSKASDKSVSPIWACTVCLCPVLQDTMHKRAKAMSQKFFNFMTVMSHYILQKILCYFIVPPKETLSKEVAKESNNRSPEYKHYLFSSFFFFFFFFFLLTQ